MIWIYGVGEVGVMASTDFGIENFIDLIKCTKTAHCSSAGTAAKWVRCGQCRRDTIQPTSLRDRTPSARAGRSKDQSVL